MFSRHVTRSYRGIIISCRQNSLVYYSNNNIARFSTCRNLRIKETTLSRRLPWGTWDGHMHVVDPEAFPLDANAQYKPHPHTLADARAFYSRLGIKNMVFVQPSIYGTDNSCMLEALREVGPRRGRAVVGIDPAMANLDTLKEWHALGVRGARLNLVSVGRELSEAELHKELESYTVLMDQLDWVLELFVPMKMIVALERILPILPGLSVCIDHFGWPTIPPYDPSHPLDPYSLVGFESLVHLLERESAWVKISAPYRLSKDPQMRDLDAVGRELIQQAPEKVIYATDWPHTRYENIDPVPFIEKCLEWCGDDERRVEKLFRENAIEVWGPPWGVDEQDRRSPSDWPSSCDY